MSQEALFLLDQIAQIGLAGFGVLAIWLSASPSARSRKNAAIVGLCAEPFWFLTAAINLQWGIGLLAVCYTVAWWRIYASNKKQMRQAGS